MAKKVGLDVLAAELGQEPLSFFMKIQELGFDFDTPNSMISAEEADKIKNKLKGLEAAIKVAPKPSVIRRQAKKVEPIIEEAPPPVVEKAVEAAPIVSEQKSVKIEAAIKEAMNAQQPLPQPPAPQHHLSEEEKTENEVKKGKKKGKKARFDSVIEIPELEEIIALEEVANVDEEEKRKEEQFKRDKKKELDKIEDAKPSKKKLKGADVAYEEQAIAPQREKNYGHYLKHKKKKVQQTRYKQTEITTPKAIKRVIKIEESISVGELSQRIGVKSSEVIKKLFALGIMANINQSIDADAAALIATEFGYEVEKVSLTIQDVISKTEDKPEQLKHRPPVVTIMGHVDHGKTSLLDVIRETNVTEGEAGGITQHIGAYEVMINGKEIVFLDTPGHEAFTAMRARGVKVTDLVVLVVAADDGVMPQTKEAINHAKAAGVPIIVAINKIDKPTANPQRVKQDLMNHGLVAEEWGGDTIFAEVSARQKIGITQLLEMITLQAEVLELKANPDKPAKGVVIESKLDRGLGPVATVLIQEGTLKVGDSFITGSIFGKVRALINDKGKRVHFATPSIPVEVLGLSETPEAGDEFYVVADERKAKMVISQRQQQSREKGLAKLSTVTLEELYQKIKDGNIKELNIILKADVQGSCQAVKESLLKVSTGEVKIRIIHESVGGITESDVMLAAASSAIIIGFSVRPEPKAALLASKENVDIRLYTIIYEAVSDIEKALKGLLAPVKREALLGHASVREVFSVPKLGKIAGSFITDGKITRNSKVRVLRDNAVIYDGKIGSLRRFKDDAKEVLSGYECGIGVENFNDIKVGDVLESYIIEEIKQDLT